MQSGAVADPWETLKLLADPTRVRLLNLLWQEELSVAELQDILEMGQSRISSHLALLRSANIVNDRRDGKRTYYSMASELNGHARDLIQSSLKAVERQPEVERDRTLLKRILEQRRQVADRYFNEVAGRLGRNYCPGRSWEALSHFLLLLTPHIDIADLGAGEAAVSLLLARRARSVFCIDRSAKMVEVGSRLAEENGVGNLKYVLGDIEDVPLPDSSVDLSLLSQALHHAEHPQKAITEAVRILRPGGRLVILDLKEHDFEKARELYADLWLGFRENLLYDWLRQAGLQKIEVRTVAKEEMAPYFETLLAVGEK